MSDGIGMLRWHAKKAARQIVSYGTHWVRSVAGQSPAFRALTYHRFGNEPNEPFCLSPDDFERQIEFVAENDLAISLDELIHELACDAETPRNRVLITIDDGFACTVETALPILEHYAVPSVAFVSPDLIGTAPGDGHARYMNWKELEKTANTGMRIGSHSMRHESYGRLTITDVSNDARTSKSILEDRLGYEVTSLAYPYGTRADTSERIAEVVSECGYKVAFTSIHGPVSAQDNPMLLRRIKIESGDDDRFFGRATDGAMDSWAIVDNHLSFLQANH